MAVLPRELVLFCISPSPHGNKFQPELLFLSPKFHSFKSKPLCLSLLLYLLLVSMVTPLSALYTIYLSLRFPLCLSHSVLIFLILLSSLPPFLLLYPTPSSLWLLSLFTFICLSPFSPLQACHSIMLFFFSVSYLWRARERKKSFICCPINSAFLITFQSSNPVSFPLAQSLIYMCARQSGQFFNAHPWAASLFFELSEGSGVKRITG